MPPVVSYWISTSNHNWSGELVGPPPVVSYWISTSNHNCSCVRTLPPFVVSYWISTSNHNAMDRTRKRIELYLIEFLHQTTTSNSKYTPLSCCILLNFYIKPQHLICAANANSSCILLNFYIKPQPASLHRRSRNRCILLNFYIKPQLRTAEAVLLARCILLNFYIKPQPVVNGYYVIIVVSYWISTSNHNHGLCSHWFYGFYARFPDWKKRVWTPRKSIWCLFSYFKEQI